MRGNTLGYLAKYCILVFLMILIPKFSSANNYVFTVHTTKACPRNHIEMDERSLAINCKKRNGYTCLPDKNLTVLLEFCYKRVRIAVPKGYCLFLRYSDVDAYDCKRFIYGCPDADYYSDEIYKYPNCVSIGSGCFLADASCDRLSAAATKTVTTNSKDFAKNTNLDDRIWILLLGVLILMCTVICIVCIIHKQKSSQRQRNKYMKTHIEIRTTERVNKSFSSDYASDNDAKSIILDHTDDSEMSPLDIVIDSSSNQIEFASLYKPFEQGLDTRVTPSLNDITCQYESDDIVQLLLDTTADVSLCDSSRSSPLLRSSISGHDTASLMQTDMRTFANQIPIQPCLYCML